MSCALLVRAAMKARREGRWQQAARLLAGAAPRATNPQQRFAIGELAYELAA
jgi:hypothetical protein